MEIAPQHQGRRLGELLCLFLGGSSFALLAIAWMVDFLTLGFATTQGPLESMDLYLAFGANRLRIYDYVQPGSLHEMDFDMDYSRCAQTWCKDLDQASRTVFLLTSIAWGFSFFSAFALAWHWVQRRSLVFAKDIFLSATAFSTGLAALILWRDHGPPFDKEAELSIPAPGGNTLQLVNLQVDYSLGYSTILIITSTSCYVVQITILLWIAIFSRCKNSSKESDAIEKPLDENLGLQGYDSYLHRPEESTTNGAKAIPMIIYPKPHEPITRRQTVAQPQIQLAIHPTQSLQAESHTHEQRQSRRPSGQQSPTQRRLSQVSPSSSGSRRSSASSPTNRRPSQMQSADSSPNGRRRAQSATKDQRIDQRQISQQELDHTPRYGLEMVARVSVAVVSAEPEIRVEENQTHQQQSSQSLGYGLGIVAPVSVAAVSMKPEQIVEEKQTHEPSQREFANYGTEQLASWLETIGLGYLSSKVLDDGIIGQDIIETPYDRMVIYFGDDEANRILQIVGGME